MCKGRDVRAPRILRVGVATLLAVSFPAAWLVVEAEPAAADVAPVANPPIADSCGVDTTVVLDASGSVSSSGAVDDVRDAADAFLDALKNTSSTARVTQFATVAQELAPYTIVDDASLAQNGVLRRALNKYYNPKPPLAGRPAKEYRGGDVFSAGSWKNGTSDQYTNWDQSLDQANDQPSELLVYVTDGDPTAYDFQGSPDPFSPPAVGYRTDQSSQARQESLDRAVVEANLAKQAGARVLAVGVGSALNNQASVDRLVAVSGPQVVRNLSGITSLNQVDVALVQDFDQLARFLRGVVLQLCSPSLTIRKLAQSPESADYVPAPGWTMTVAPEVPTGTGFTWILPDTTPAISKSSVTDAAGFAQFQWEPKPPEADSRATVTEALLPDFVAGRDAAIPGADDPPDWRCELRDEDGKLRVVSGDFPATGPPQFVLDPIRQEVVTCTLWNSYDYQPGIAVAKRNDPPEVRGDLVPPAQVTSTFEVTIPSTANTPLANVAVVDDRCSPTPVLAGSFNVGDVDKDGLLDLTETWEFTCTRDISSPSSTDPNGRRIVNTATALGTTPEGELVTSGPATDDVVAFNPRIAVTKDVAVDDETPDYADVQTGTPPLDVLYRYRVTATGNTPLDDVRLADDTAPCSGAGAIVRQSDAPGNDDARLELGETWVYTCAATLTGPDPGAILNTATVSGLPVDPTTGTTTWYGRPNPRVTDTDTAEVRLATPGIQLTKTASPALVLLPPSGGSATVTYRFGAENTGTEPLVRPVGGGVNAPGWVADAQCDAAVAPVLSGGSNVGDVNTNNQMDPGETWQFTCTNTVSGPTPNIATIAAVGLTTGSTVSDRAVALVDVVRPGILVNKTALRSVVLDPAADAVAGPDVPRRPAEYQYEVVNTGNVPLDLVPDPPTDDVCKALVFDMASDDGNGLLDVGEVWSYTCEQILDREDDANTPPITNGSLLSGLVQNTFSVTGVPFFEGANVTDPALFVTDTDQAQVLVIEPGISLTKTASPAVVLKGSTVTYTLEVRNTGDVGLDVLGVIDDKCAPLTFVGGDGTPLPDGSASNDPNGILDGANSGLRVPEVWTYTCARPVVLPTAPATAEINEAVVFASDPLGNLYLDRATASVRVIDPDIGLVKTVDLTLVPVGTTVTYTFAVSNTGRSPIAADDVLAKVTLVDVAEPATPACDSPTYGGDTNGDGLLDRVPPETWIYTCSVAINAPTIDVAVVGALGGTLLDPPLEVPVFDLDAAFVQTFQPAIDIVKSASPTQVLVSGPVTYTYEVRNTGDVPLADVKSRIVDDKCSPVTYVSGDDDGDGLLDTPNSIFEDAVDEVWLFTCTTTISQDTVNTVAVTGTPTNNIGTPLCGGGGTAQQEPGQIPSCDVTDSAQARVIVTAIPPIPPDPPVKPPKADLVVVKTPATSTVPPGGDIDYVITVTNKGPDDALNVTLLDTFPPELLNPRVVDDGPYTCAVSGQTVRCTIAVHPVGVTATIKLRATVSPDAGAGSIVNRVVVGSCLPSTSTTKADCTPDPNPGDNTDVGDIIVEKPLPPTGSRALDTTVLGLVVLALGVLLVTVRRREARAG